MVSINEQYTMTITRPNRPDVVRSGELKSFSMILSRSAPRRVKPKGDLRLSPTAFSLYKEFGRLFACGISHRHEEANGTPVNDVYTYAGPVDGSGYAYPGILSHKVTYDNVSNKLLTKLKAQNVNLGQLWGERAQTQRLFVSAAGRLVNSYRALRKGQLGKAVGQLTGFSVHKDRRLLHDFVLRNNRAAAERWLEFQYGIKPIISDLYGAVDELFRKERTDAYTFMVQASSKVKTQENSLWSAYHNGGYDWMRRICDREDSIRAQIMFRKPHVVYSDLTSVGVFNLPAILWELTPWSFVVDWALPIGAYLSALDATAGLQFVAGWETRRSVRKVQSVFEKVGPYASYSRYRGGTTSVDMPQSGMQKRVTRSIITGFPVPVLRWKNPLSTTHVLNAMALLATAKRSLVR